MKEILTNKIAWIDLISPTKDDLHILETELKIPKEVIDQLSRPSDRNKTEFYDDFFYNVLFFPNWNETTKLSEPEELDVVVFKNYIITVRYSDKLRPLNEFIKECESCEKEHREKILGDTTYETFYHLIEELLEFSNRQLKNIEDKILLIEKDAFEYNSKNNSKMIYTVLSIKRDLLMFRRIFLTLQNSIKGLDYKGEKFWGIKSKPYMLDLINDCDKVWNTIEHHSSLLASFESTFYSLISNNTETLTRIYTIISFIAWPTLLVISWYQTNTNWLPFSGMKYDSYIVFSMALIPSVLIYAYLRKNKLL